MWNNFNEIAEGFGLNVGEFQKIVDIEGLKATAADARAVFKCFDTDNVRQIHKAWHRVQLARLNMKCSHNQSLVCFPFALTRMASWMRWSF